MRMFEIIRHSSVLTLSIVTAIALLSAGTSPGSAAQNYIKVNRSAIGTSQRIPLGLNKSVVIDLPGDAHDILVANPEVADAITRTSRRIYLFGKQVGETNIFIFDASGAQLLSVDLVVERDISGLEANIEKYVPGSDVKIEMVNDNVVLTGSVPTPQASARASQLARIFVTGGEATANNFSDSGDTDDGSGSSIIFDSGDDRPESQIVNLLKIDGEDQVHLKVTIAEIQRTIVKQLGIDLSATGTNIGGLVTGAFTDNPFALGKIGSRSGASFDHASSGISGVLRALDQTGVLRTLAEPTLTAISGEAASFFVGGEFPISNGKTEEDGTVIYENEVVEYGISLNFIPVVLSPGRISMKIRTQVSEPTTEGYHNIPRGSAASTGRPGIRRRLADTTVELPSGGSLVIAGLIKDDVRQSISGFPGLRNLPVLGALFRSRDFQRYETELVIIVTPYLVRPVARQKLARPDDNFMPASDAAGIFLSRVNRIYGTVNAKLPKGRYHGAPGFIFD